jgi:SnoaL-like domain
VVSSSQLHDARVELLLDKAAITDLIYKYAWGVDSRDGDVLRKCFADIVVVDGRESPRDKWVDVLLRAVAGYQSTHHLISNEAVDVNGETGSCRAYLQAVHYLPNESGEPYRIMAGHYHFELAREREGWLITSYELTVTWTRGNWYLPQLAKEKLARELSE